MTLGEKIQKLRQQQGLSQDALAEKLGVSRQAVSKWERDEAVPELEKIVKLSEVFGVSLDMLLRDQPPEPPRETPPETPPRRRSRVTGLEVLQWGGLLGGAALIVWSLPQFLSVLLVSRVINGAASDAVNGAVNEYVFLEGAEVVAPFFQKSAQLLQLTLIVPTVKVLAGVVLICLGLWARKRRRAKS